MTACIFCQIRNNVHALAALAVAAVGMASVHLSRNRTAAIA